MYKVIQSNNIVHGDMVGGDLVASANTQKVQING